MVDLKILTLSLTYIIIFPLTYFIGPSYMLYYSLVFSIVFAFHYFYGFSDGIRFLSIKFKEFVFVIFCLVLISGISFYIFKNHQDYTYIQKAIIMAPVVEELYYRSVLHEKLRNYFEMEFLLVIFIALLFSLNHAFVISSNLQYIVILLFAILVGSIIELNVDFYKSFNILIPIVIHSLFNSFIFVLHLS